jgi:transglutaminase-like putative cysteine protease
MIFNITHTTAYAYSRPVFLEPHILRFRPRTDGRQRVQRFELILDPKPAGISEQTDAENNRIAQVWFTNLTESLTVTAKSVVETSGVNPFDYLPEPSAQKLPISYDENLRARLAIYLRRDKPDDNLRQLADEILRETDSQTLPFLYKLTDWISRNCRSITREHGHPHPAPETLAKREGACRDVAVLLIEICRNVGIAARFVTGYEGGEIEEFQHQLHSWAEVYIPGGGWRGYDPTYGIAVADRHVAVAASAEPRDAMPIVGTFRGTDATSKMKAHVELTMRPQ